MFDGPDYPKSLSEETFNSWLEKGRQSKIGYEFLLVVWDEYESEYRAVYAANRDELITYDSDKKPTTREWLVAAYNLYSESRII